MPNILIVGAGKLGRGFLGETFHTAGWNIAFLDNDPAVIDAISGGSYRVNVHEQERTFVHEVDGFAAYLCDEAHSCQAAFNDADLIALCLYPEDIDVAATYLAPCFEARAAAYPDRKLTILSCTNKNHIMPHVRGEFLRPLSPAALKWFEENVALRDVIIRRSTNAPSTASLVIDSRAVATLLIQKPIYCDLSHVGWMEPIDNLEALKDIKLYTYNSTHAASAYAAAQKGYKTMNDAMDDDAIFSFQKEVLDESCAGLLREYPISEKELYDFCYVLRVKLHSPLPDTVFRVAYDPLRKLSHNDRLTGNALLCLKYGIDPPALIRAIACGMAYDEANDPASQRIQQLIRENGIAAATAEVCDLPIDHELVRRVSEIYEGELKK